MSALRIDGKALAERIKQQLAAEVHALRASGLTPGLAVVLVGEDPASQVYVKNKIATCEALGMASFHHRLPASTSEAELLALIARLNADASVHGILVQLPLPKHIAEARVIEAIAPEKDVDGFHAANIGALTIGRPRFAPCTPAGCMELLASIGLTDLRGKHAVVIGRSNIVGKPMALLLLHANATVTLCHSATANLTEHTRRADILVAAVGRPRFVTAEMVKPGAVVIDVGINRLPASEGGGLVGDVDFERVREVAGAITPVPGGVGPMTIAMLMKNTLAAAKALNG
ncbi:MAG: bifunctional methylenetetrahydrofolate dehydrogenase/methenyltetrahydrofolate cyclohydrolase FolD [Casimicrobiaceae bacterium]|nr:bifunctional methylenetetrahydrofolate dehydrogenase/methenyltetrahydrofolate cyclohydrolase FolD [Casimicrobiaceae bacterium]